MKIFNLKHLVSIEFNKRSKTNLVWYLKKDRKGLFNKEKAGFYCIKTYPSCYVGTKIPENYTLIGNTVYANCEVILKFSNGDKQVKYFDNNVIGEMYYNNIKKHIINTSIDFTFNN